MSIADTDVIKITQGQLKYIAQEVKEAARSGLSKTLTSADYNYDRGNTGSYNCVGMWLLPDGFYSVSPGTYVYYDKTYSLASTYQTFLITTFNSRKYYLLFTEANTGANNMLIQYGRTTENTHTGYLFLSRANVVDNLTSTYTDAPLSAKQGKVLKDLVDSLIISDAGAPTTSTVGTVGQIYTDTVGGKAYICTAVDSTTTPATYTWEEVGSKVNVVQTTGNSQTDVMSQNATTSMVFADPSTASRIRIGNINTSSANAVTIGTGTNGTSSGVCDYAVAIGWNAVCGGHTTVAIGSQSKASNNGGTAIGRSAQCNNVSSVALGAYSSTSEYGEVNIGSTASNWGYRQNSNYRLLTGLYDPQNAHDAATKGYVDTVAASVEPDTVNATDWSGLWQ